MSNCIIATLSFWEADKIFNAQSSNYKILYIYIYTHTPLLCEVSCSQWRQGETELPVVHTESDVYTTQWPASGKLGKLFQPLAVQQHERPVFVEPAYLSVHFSCSLAFMSENTQTGLLMVFGLFFFFSSHKQYCSLVCFSGALNQRRKRKSGSQKAKLPRDLSCQRKMRQKLKKLLLHGQLWPGKRSRR